MASKYFVLVLVVLSYYCGRSSLLWNSIAVYELWLFSSNFSEELSKENKMNLSWALDLNYSLRRQNILSLFYLIYRLVVKKNKYKNKIKNKKKLQDNKLHAIPRFSAGSFVVHIGDHFRSGIICGLISGSFPVWGSFAVGDQLQRCTGLWKWELLLALVIRQTALSV